MQLVPPFGLVFPSELNLGIVIEARDQALSQVRTHTARQPQRFSFSETVSNGY